MWTMNRSARCAVALVLALGLVMQSADVAGAVEVEQINRTVGEAWPFPVNTQQGNVKTGMSCTVRAWSFDATQSPGSNYFAWTDDRDGYIAANCEILTGAGYEPDPSIPASCSYPDRTQMEPAFGFAVPFRTSAGGSLFATSFTVPAARSGSYQVNHLGNCPTLRNNVAVTGTTLQVVRPDFNGVEGSTWLRLRIQIKLHAGCQPGGSLQGTAACNSLSTSPTFNGDLAREFPDTICANMSFMPMGNFYGLPEPLQNQSVESTQAVVSGTPTCNVEAGVGAPDGFGPMRPDDGIPPTQAGGLCKLDDVVVETRGGLYGEDWEQFETENGFGGALRGQEFRFSFVATYPQDQNVYARIKVRNVRDSDHPEYEGQLIDTIRVLLEPFPLTTTASWSAPDDESNEIGAGFYHFTFECEVVGGGGEYEEWHHPEDAAGPGGEGVVGEQEPVCAEPPCIADPAGDGGDDDGFPSPGDFSRVLDCFDGTFDRVEFLGVSVPWINVFRLPADMLCAIEALVIPRHSDWRVLIRFARVSFGQSSLGEIDDYVMAPFDAVSAFATAADGGGCGGPSFNFMGHADVAPFSACAAPIANAANIVKLGLGILAISGSVLMSARMILQALGFFEASNVTVGAITNTGGSFGGAENFGRGAGGTFE